MIHQLISRVISRIRGESYSIDSTIPVGYLFREVWDKSISFIYGLFVMRRVGCYISPWAQLRCVGSIRTQGSLVVGQDCVVDALSREGILFGRGVSVGRGTLIKCTGSLRHLGKGLKVGDCVGLGEWCHYGCAGGIEIGENTIMGAYVSMHSENHNFQDPSTPIRNQGVSHRGIKIGRNCWIGAKVTILDGSIIGDGSVVAAGAVVTGVFPRGSIIGGVPAKVLRSI